MNSDDPRGELDRFTAFLVENLRSELELTAIKLLSTNEDMALAQIEILRKSTLHRIKKLDFELWADVAALSPSEMPEDEVLKVYRITIAALEETYENLRVYTAERLEDRLKGGGDDADTE